MPFHHKRKLAAAGAALAVGGLAGGAVAAPSGNPRSPRQAFLDDASRRLNVSEAQLDGALRSAFLDRLNAAVASRRLTEAQAEKIKQQVLAQDVTPCLRASGVGRHAGAGRLGPAATYLGLTRQRLTAQLRSGRTLAEIAQAQGRTVAGLEAAMTAAAKTRLDRAVAGGRITSAQEQQFLGRLPKRLDRLVNHSWPHAMVQHG